MTYPALTFLNLNLTLLFLVLVIQNLRFLHFMQVKNFRLDRIYCLFRYENGWQKFFSPLSPVLFLISCYMVLFHLDSFGSSLCLLANLFLFRYIGLYRPKPTAKVLVICALLISLHFLNYQFGAFFNLAFSAPLASFLVCILIPLNYGLKEVYIFRAKRKLAKFPALKVVGITGSFGKSSTKSFLHHILASKYELLVTPRNINTEIGIAKLILKKLKAKHQVLLLEIGTYKQGEIKKVLQITPLDLAILTAVSNQHLSLFGSLEKLMHAKLEIFSNMRQNGKILLNQDAVPQKLFQYLPKQENYQTFAKDNSDYNLLSALPHLKVQVRDHRYQANVFAPHLQANLSLAILAGLNLGLSSQEIQHGLDNLDPNAFAVQISGTNPQVILDTYNATTAGVSSMLSLMQEYFPDASKLFVFSGFIELGDSTSKEHDKVLELSSKICQHTVLTKSLEKSINSDNVITIADLNKQLEFLAKHFREYDFVYVSGRQYQRTQNLIEKYAA